MTGTLTFSIEVELGWGLVRYGFLDKLSPGRERETATLRRLLALCDRHDIPVSFDVVGHLLLEECTGHHDGPHDEGWFDCDPGTSVDENPLFYAPDLVEAIRNSETDHEICTHTFSHVECGAVDPNVVRWELQRARAAHERRGLNSPVSLVPPTHSPPPLDVLREEEIEIIRMPPTGEERMTKFRRGLRILFGPHPADDPFIENGVVITESPEDISLAVRSLPSGQDPPHPVFRVLPMTIRRRLHARYLSESLELAVGDDAQVHLWSHLHNMANEAQWPQIEAFLAEVAERRDRGEIDVLTMDALNRRVRQSYPDDSVAASEE